MAEGKSEAEKMKKIIIIIIAVLLVALLAVMSAFILKKQYRQAKDNIRKEVCEYLPGVVCIGDSLTQGTDGAYPDYLEEMLIKDGYYIPVFNLGIGGENTRSIAGRLGGIPLMVKAFEIPDDNTPVEIEFVDDEIHKVHILRTMGRDMVNPVVIEGVAGELTRTEEGQYYFARITDEEELDELNDSQLANIENYVKYDSVEEYPVETKGQTEYQDGIYIVFMGENGGFADIEDLINQQKAILSRQTKNSDKFLIIGLTTGDAKGREELETAMAEEYGDRYINLRAYFTGTKTDGLDIKEEALRYGVEFSDNDIQAMSEGKVPDCLRGDDIHYNNAGYRLLAELVYMRMTNLGYFEEVKPLTDKYLSKWGLVNNLEIWVNNL